MNFSRKNSIMEAMLGWGWVCCGRGLIGLSQAGTRAIRDDAAQHESVKSQESLCYAMLYNARLATYRAALRVRKMKSVRLA